MGDDMGEEETSASSQQKQQQQQRAQLTGELAMQPWQARLAGHAEAIQQLDKDSLCRLSDPYQHPSKRSRSCPPDSFGAAPHQPADSTDAVHAAHSSDALSDCDDAMSDKASDVVSAGQDGQVVQSSPDLHQQPQPDALTVLEGGACHLTASTLLNMPPGVPALPAQQLQDSLDMTQPNLTPADQRHRLAALGSTDPRTAPVRPFPGTTLFRPAADLDPDLECERLAGAGPSSSRPTPKLNLPGDDSTAQGQRHQDQQQQQQQQAIGRQGSGPYGLGKGKAAKWKQRAGLRDTGFGENEQPVVASDGVGTRQGETLSACVLLPYRRELFANSELPG